MNPQDEIKQILEKFDKELEAKKRKQPDKIRVFKHHGLVNLSTLVVLHELKRQALIVNDIYKAHVRLINRTTLYSIIHRLEELGFIATNGYGQYILTEAGLLLYKALMASRLGEEFRNSDHYSM